MPTCFFLGSRHANSSLSPLLDEAIERHIVEYGGDGSLWWGTTEILTSWPPAPCARAKARHPEIRLPAADPIPPPSSTLWRFPPGFDDTYYPEGLETVPKRYAIVHADRALVRAQSVPDRLPRSGGSPGNSPNTPSAVRRQGKIQVTPSLPNPSTDLIPLDLSPNSYYNAVRIRTKGSGEFFMEKDRELLDRFYVCTNKMDGLYYLAARRLGVKENAFALLYALDDGRSHSQKAALPGAAHPQDHRQHHCDGSTWTWGYLSPGPQ